ncbi:hypothetical protein K1719_040319 [Acacia pycnantha]|nr:hypothetical protein K1719_040319 [Acacia pycnantha]
MVPFLYLLLLASSLIPVYAQNQPTDQSSMSLVITQDGLDFVKDLLVNEAISSMIPLRLPNIIKTVKIPLVGNAFMMLSNITLYQIDAFMTKAVLQFRKLISSSAAKVEDMDIGLTLGMENQEESLKLVLEDTRCDIKDISIKLDGSWLYQGMVDAFEGQIGSRVDNAITKKLKDGISRLDSFFQKLPKEISVNNDASLIKMDTNTREQYDELA